MARRKRTDLSSRGPRYRVSWYFADVRNAFLWGMGIGAGLLFAILRGSGRI
jgi:hypothetical protein